MPQLRRLTFPSRFEKGERIDIDKDEVTSSSDNGMNFGSVVPLKDMTDGAASTETIDRDMESQSAARRESK